MDLRLASDYRSSTHLLGRDVLAKLLEQSSVYRRAVAFFSSGVLGVASVAFKEFFARGGRMRLICSPCLSRSDAIAFAAAVYSRGPTKARFSAKGIDRAYCEARPPFPEIFGWYMAMGFVEVRIAHIPQGFERSLYHEKLALFEDGSGQLVTFSGSANESRVAYTENFERVDVFSSFGNDSDRRRARGIEHQFNALWVNETPGVEVLPLHEALRRRLLRTVPDDQDRAPPTLPPLDSDGPLVPAFPEILIQPSELELRPHQTHAIAAWASAGGRGVLEMATGSGKTITALALALRMSEGITGGFAILIIAPLIHLVDQWRRESKSFGLDPIRCAEGVDLWHSELAVAIDTLNSGARPLLSIVTTASTMTGDSFQRLIRGIRKPMLLVGDEVHNYGAPRTWASLPKNATYRLGLSATPERWRDEEGTERLRDYFGPTAFSYSLSDALTDGVLTPYRYYPQIVELNATEAEEYLRLTRQLVRLLGPAESGPPSEAVKTLLIKRARVVATAEAKLPLLRKLLAAHKGESHILIYCGDGSLEAEDDVSVRQIDAVTRMVGVELKMRCAQYTADTAPRLRQEVLRDFAGGDLQALVAIRCLDEGVDVPATRTAFLLASSTNPRQYVQRRGRVLRAFAGKRRADIYDFFVMLPVESRHADPAGWQAARNLLKNQLARALEFGDLAENGPVARAALLELRDRYELLTEG